MTEKAKNTKDLRDSDLMEGLCRGVVGRWWLLEVEEGEDNKLLRLSTITGLGWQGVQYPRTTFASIPKKKKKKKKWTGTGTRMETTPKYC